MLFLSPLIIDRAPIASDDGVLTEITNSLVANNFHSATVGIISHRLWPDDRYRFAYYRRARPCLFIEECEPHYRNCVN